MKIMLVHDLLNEVGGAEQIVAGTKTILEEAGHSVLLYAPIEQGSFIHSVFSIGHYLSVHKAIHRFKPDIMHVHNVYRNVSPAVLLAARREKIPIVMTLHDFQIVCPKTSLVDANLLSCKTGFGYRCFYSDCYPRKPFNRIYQGLKSVKLSLHRLIIRKTVRHYVSPSVCLMNWARNNFGVKPVSLLPNFAAYEHEPSSRLPQGHMLLFIGKLVEQKGVDVLIKALARVRTVIPDVRLKVIGCGPEEHRLKKLAAELQVSELITFTGSLSNVQVMKEYEDAFSVVMPSKYVENSSIVGIEALSRGRIIIASNIGGFPDVVEDQRTGFLVRPNDPDDLSEKIIYVMQNHALLSGMGTLARAKYEQSFSKSAYYRSLVSVYENILQDSL